ncbi:DUF7684 family protein [Tunturibacter empetritectus]|uniref:DUF7684 domain-containing protein n=1 Tax=Tunturiibacter lichenicola TaxID=2051959 RepID=A0A7W8N5H7_9BACT|nr:hypothetical protein [Edaphobacter lichenicola]MBB5345573.1 hypothetical protein [Edaphobacter lichenicola]
MLEMQRDMEHPKRRFCVGGLSSLKNVKSALDGVSKHFCLFLAIDATSVTDGEIRETAKLLLERGIAYLCVWGPDCERVHDQFDLERMPDEPKGQIVMTTWHSKESLSEALWFFANCVEQDHGFEALCTDWIALNVSNDSWGQRIRAALIERL